MAIVLYNPTNEVFEGLYIGNVTKIMPDQKVKVEDNRGRFLLNDLGPRGLVQLEYGDEGEAEKRKAESGRRRNKEFKRKQIIRYNQQNEARQNSKLPYLDPPQQIKEYAKELGIGLLEPYNFQDKTMEEMSTLKEEISSKDRLLAKKDRDLADMQSQIGTMQDQLNQLMGLMRGNMEKAPDNGDEQRQVDIVELKKDLGYATITKDHYEAWITRNYDKYETAPPEIQDDMREKFVRFYNKPFPEERPEA